MVFIAVLSGFGAINLPFSFFHIYDEKSNNNSKKITHILVLLINQSMFDTKMIQILDNISAKKIRTLQLKQRLQEDGDEGSSISK